jgi:hypothetical protein
MFHIYSGINMITKRRKAVLSALVLSLVGCASLQSCATTDGPATPVPSYQVGDRWTYQAQDTFLAKPQWTEIQEVMAVDQSGITVRITQRGDGIFNVRTEEWSAPGQVRVGAVYDHETRHFDAPLQRFDFPLAPGEKWNQWVGNSEDTMKTRGTVNLYVRVEGWEKISTPAGTFDAIKLHVVMHLDDGEFWRLPPTSIHSVWYAPAVRNVVREERDTDYVESSVGNGDTVRTQHAVLQLSEFTTSSR